MIYWIIIKYFVLVILNKTCKFHSPLIKYSIEKLDKNNSIDIIKELTENYRSRCDLCGYNNNKTLLEDDYSNSVSVIYSNILYPEYLSIIFDSGNDINLKI